MEKKVLLIADDIQMNRTVIRRFFNGDFTVLEAEDGVEALELLRSTHVDMLLLDIIMPLMDGLELLEAINSDSSIHRPGILVATSVKEKTERSVLALGADDVVAKPYDPIVIQRRLENILAKKELERMLALARSATPEQVHAELAAQYRDRVRARTAALHHLADLGSQSAENADLIRELCDELHTETARLEAMFEEG